MGNSSRGVPAAATLASTLVMGSGPECLHERFCLPGLRSTYGLIFKEFRTLDPGGPETASALRDGKIDVGVLFTTDSHLLTEGFVVLDDDRHLQPAENVTPVLRMELVDQHGPDLVATLDAVSAKLTTEGLAEMNRAVGIVGISRSETARRWLEREGLLSLIGAKTKVGQVIIVGSANFSESQTVAELYTQALGAMGYPTEQASSIGNRDTYFPRLEHGDLGLVPEYIGSLLAYLHPGGTESADVDVSYGALEAPLRARGITALRPASAEAKNGIVVTTATADKHRLQRVSDLGRPI